MEGSSPAAASISVAGTEERVAGDAVGIREFARSAAWATIACPSPVIIILSNKLKYRSVDDFRLGSFSAIAQRARACSKRSEGRRVGKECVLTCRSRGAR